MSFGDFVTEFGDRGYLLGGQWPMPDEQRAKYRIEVTENLIRNKYADDYGLENLPDDSDFCYAIPLDAILEFAVSLQLRFPNVSLQQVVRWPKEIELELKKTGATYDPSFDYTPDLMNIELEDPFFFANHGRPQVATAKASFSSPTFDTPVATYFIDVEVFTAERAQSTSRLAHTSLLKAKD
jgi:hypothetical protein